MNVIALDLETSLLIDEPVLTSMKADVKAPSTWKDPVKIAAEVARKQAAMLEGAALSALTGQVCAVSLAFMDTKDREWSHTVFTGEKGEEALLHEFAEWLDFDQDDLIRWLTFEGQRFDFPFLLPRLAAYGIELPVPLPMRDWKRHVDLSLILGEGSLDAWSKRLLGRGKLRDASEIPGLAAAGEWGEIRTYCENEIHLLTDLYDVISPNLYLAGVS